MNPVTDWNHKIVICISTEWAEVGFMKEIRKIAGDASRGARLLLVKCSARSATEESEHMMDEIHKRATEVGPVLEGILHIHCEGTARLWN
jgi:hypothetical protein